MAYVREPRHAADVGQATAQRQWVKAKLTTAEERANEEKLRVDILERNLNATKNYAPTKRSDTSSWKSASFARRASSHASPMSPTRSAAKSGPGE